MKCQALCEGFDGYSGFEEGHVFQDDSEFVRMLLFNGGAEPLDKEAKDFVHAAEHMTPQQKKDHKNFSPGLAQSMKEKPPKPPKPKGVQTKAEEKES